MDESITPLSASTVLAGYADVLEPFEERGISLMHWQAAVGQPATFEHLVTLLKEALIGTQTTGLPKPPHPHGVRRLLAAINYWSDRDINDNIRAARREMVYRYCNANELKLLLAPIMADDRALAVVIQRFGLDEGHCKKLKTICEPYGVTVEAIRRSEAKALVDIRRGIRQVEFKSALRTGGGLDFAVNVLDLIAKIQTCLAKAQLHTVGELTSKTRDFLESITNLGPSGVDQIEAELDKYGLSLAHPS